MPDSGETHEKDIGRVASSISNKVNKVKRARRARNKIKSVSDAIGIVDKVKKTQSGKPKTWIWFRGCPNKEYKLEPSIFRFNPNFDLSYFNETSIFNHSKARLAGLQKTYSSQFDWLCMMQHYSMPTRILDWTESILVALYFTIRYPNEDYEDGRLTILDASGLNRSIAHVIGKGKYARMPKIRHSGVATPESNWIILRSEMVVSQSRKYLQRLAIFDGMVKKMLGNRKDIGSDVLADFIIESCATPIAVFPNRLNERMHLQSSVFTLHGGKLHNSKTNQGSLPAPITLEEVHKITQEKDFPLYEERYQASPILQYYEIPKVCKPEIRRTLFNLGIHEGSLFPEMENQATYLKQVWGG